MSFPRAQSGLAESRQSWAISREVEGYLKENSEETRAFTNALGRWAAWKKKTNGGFLKTLFFPNLVKTPRQWPVHFSEPTSTYKHEVDFQVYVTPETMTDFTYVLYHFGSQSPLQPVFVSDSREGNYQSLLNNTAYQSLYDMEEHYFRGDCKFLSESLEIVPISGFQGTPVHVEIFRDDPTVTCFQPIKYDTSQGFANSNAYMRKYGKSPPITYDLGAAYREGMGEYARQDVYEPPPAASTTAPPASSSSSQQTPAPTAPPAPGTTPVGEGPAGEEATSDLAGGGGQNSTAYNMTAPVNNTTDAGGSSWTVSGGPGKRRLQTFDPIIDAVAQQTDKWTGTPFATAGVQTFRNYSRGMPDQTAGGGGGTTTGGSSGALGTGATGSGGGIVGGAPGAISGLALAAMKRSKMHRVDYAQRVEFIPTLYQKIWEETRPLTDFVRILCPQPMGEGPAFYNPTITYGAKFFALIRLPKGQYLFKICGCYESKVFPPLEREFGVSVPWVNTKDLEMVPTISSAFPQLLVATKEEVEKMYRVLRNMFMAPSERFESAVSELGTGMDLRV